VNDNADSNTDESEKWNEEPKEGILRTEKQIILREVNRCFGGIRAPMKRIVV
jgi:hypothetical protein